MAEPDAIIIFTSDLIFPLIFSFFSKEQAKAIGFWDASPMKVEFAMGDELRYVLNVSKSRP